MTLMGFGAVAYAAEPSSVLRKATTMRVIDSGTCASRLLPNRRLPQGIADQQFCTMGSSQDACEGDSGGPLVVELSDVDKLIPFVVGITSLGTGCGEGSVGLYTKVSQYISWVQSVTKSNFNKLQCSRKSVCREYFKDIRSPFSIPTPKPRCLWTNLRRTTTAGTACRTVASGSSPKCFRTMNSLASTTGNPLALASSTSLPRSAGQGRIKP
uniref:Serine protease snake n=1 Tax=Culex pipiens TaxID=7175 RepID=A0A8D8BKI6_CULPI